MNEMSRNRKWIANLAISICLGLSLAASVFNFECWPFSSYAMYSERQAQQFFNVRLYAYYQIGSQIKEIALSSTSVLWPFNDLQFNKAISNQLHSPQRLALLLKSFLRHYKEKPLHQKAGWQLRGLRLYEVGWDLNPQSKYQSPQYKKLISEVVNEF